MDDALCVGIDSLGSVVAGVVESCVIVKLVVADKTERPEHARAGLVANLNPLHVDAVVLERGEHVLCVLSHGSLHLCEVVLEVSPCGGDVLLAWVSPRVGVMEVYHDALAERLGTPSLYEHVLLA